MSPGAYNHQTPSAQTGAREASSPVTWMLWRNVKGPLGNREETVCGLFPGVLLQIKRFLSSLAVC